MIRTMHLFTRKYVFGLRDIYTNWPQIFKKNVFMVAYFNETYLAFWVGIAGRESYVDFWHFM